MLQIPIIAQLKGSIICITLYYELLIYKAFRYGTC